ncbi:MAG: hypothetical protein R8L07_03150 [Alphaproteobacteria bacterium]|nr:hypothetical protein [Alphaproteobacteria bacterium]
MIEVDYGNYLAIQAEWANGLMRAAEYAHGKNDDSERDLTLAAGGALARLSDVKAPKILRFED